MILTYEPLVKFWWLVNQILKFKKKNWECKMYMNIWWKFEKFWGTFEILKFFLEISQKNAGIFLRDCGLQTDNGNTRNWMTPETLDETKHWNLKPSLLEDCWNLLFINLLKPIVHNFVIYLHEDSKNPLFKEFKISVSKTFWIYSLLIF